MVTVDSDDGARLTGPGERILDAPGTRASRGAPAMVPGPDRPTGAITG
jgi:hypothetical protein